MDQKNTRFDASDECHKKAFDVLAPLRYKVAFTEHLAAYFRQLADGASTWDSSYEAAKKRYAETRDQFTSTFKGASVAIVEETAFTNAFMTFVAAIPYGLASKEADMYRSSASDFEVRMKAAMKEYDMAGWRTGEGGKALETCLLVGLKIQITLSDTQPEEGKDIRPGRASSPALRRKTITGTGRLREVSRRRVRPVRRSASGSNRRVHLRRSSWIVPISRRR